MNCVNLKKMFGKRYRVRYEESYWAEHGENARVEDPWLMVIPCRNGHISPWGGFNLVASTNHLGPVANALKRLPFTTMIREGDDGCDVLFDIQHVDAVLQVMKPRKRRRLSPEERAKRTKRLHEYWANKTQVRTLAEPVEALEKTCTTSQTPMSVCGSVRHF